MLVYKCPNCKQKVTALHKQRASCTEKGVSYKVVCSICLYKVVVRVEPYEEIPVKRIQFRTVNMN